MFDLNNGGRQIRNGAETSALRELSRDPNDVDQISNLMKAGGTLDDLGTTSNDTLRNMVGNGVEEAMSREKGLNFKSVICHSQILSGRCRDRTYDLCLVRAAL